MTTIPIHANLMGKLPKIEFEWTATPSTNKPKKLITLRHGYVERIYPCSLRKFLEQDRVVYPIPHFGVIAGPDAANGDLLRLFLEDIRELLVSDGFLRLYKWDCDFREQHVLVSRCYGTSRHRLDLRMKRGLDHFVIDQKTTSL